MGGGRGGGSDRDNAIPSSGDPSSTQSGVASPGLLRSSFAAAYDAILDLHARGSGSGSGWALTADGGGGARRGGQGRGQGGGADVLWDTAPLALRSSARPSVLSFNILLDSMGKAKQLDAAYATAQAMEEAGAKAEAVWVARAA